MKIEKKYHQRAVDFMNEIKREEEKRKSKMSEEEKVAENAQMELEVDSIIQRCNEQRSRKYRIVEPGKLSGFQKIAEHALWLAERGEMDIRVTTENLHGKIAFATDYFLLNRCTPKEMKMAFMEMIDTADEVSIGVRDGMLDLEFFYDFFVDVDKK